MFKKFLLFLFVCFLFSIKIKSYWLVFVASFLTVFIVLRIITKIREIIDKKNEKAFIRKKIEEEKRRMLIELEMLEERRKTEGSK